MKGLRMKKLSCASALVLSLLMLPLLYTTKTYAACASTFYVGTQTISGCNNPSGSGQQVPGFQLDVDKNKITLNNYNGGGIYYECHASCATYKNMEVELIGENTINSKASAQFRQENGLPHIIDAGFINIVPNFTGTGSLKIEASIPFTFEDRNAGSFGINVVGNDYKGNIGPTGTTQTTEITETTTTNPEATKDDAKPTQDNNKKEEQPFFSTTTGIIVLVAIPSALMFIIIVLMIVLIIKTKKVNKISDVKVDTEPSDQ